MASLDNAGSPAPHHRVPVEPMAVAREGDTVTISTAPVVQCPIERRPVRRRPSAAERRVGYIIAALINVIGLWIIHHLLRWGWPPFLTDSFEDLLPYITASFAATIVINLLWAVRDPAWFRHAGQIALNLVAIRAAERTWEIFPFDFTGYDPVWEAVARSVIGVSLVGLVIATIVEVVGLVRSCLGIEDHGGRRAAGR
jgi:hypothetical protein